jgi:hypothetical protein
MSTPYPNPPQSQPQPVQPPVQPAASADPVVLPSAPKTTLFLVVGVGMAVVGAWTLLQAVRSGASSGGLVATLCAGGIFLALGLFFLSRLPKVKKAYTAIGSQGITLNRAGKEVSIPWDAVVAVGVSVIHQKAAPVQSLSSAAASAIASGTALANPMVRLRFCFADGFLAANPLVARLVPEPGDEPAPFTNVAPLAQHPLTSTAEVWGVDTLAAALARYAGPRFTGVEQREALIRRA